MHSAMGRLGVHKSFIVDVTSHFGLSNPRQNCSDLFFFGVDNADRYVPELLEAFESRLKNPWTACAFHLKHH